MNAPLWQGRCPVFDGQRDLVRFMGILKIDEMSKSKTDLCKSPLIPPYEGGQNGRFRRNDNV